MATRVIMPKLTDTMTEGVVIKWHKREGDRIESGDALAEIETDKAVMDLEAFGAGTLRKILVPDQSTVPAGQLIAVIASPDEDIAPLLAETAKAPAPSAAPQPTARPPMPAPPAAPAPAPAHQVSRPSGHPAAKSPSVEEVKASPLARRMAEEAGLDLVSITPTGPGGRILKEDVEQALAARQAAPPAFEPVYEVRPLSQIRKTIARKMTQSKAPVPHFYVTNDIDMERALTVKDELADREQPIKITITDLIIRALALALTRFPQFNASFQEEGIRYHQSIHIGVAVGLDEGLIVPVLRDCQNKGLIQIAEEARLLFERAKSRRLQPDEYTGATFSLSNLGMEDVEQFSAIITPPEAAVLAVGKIKPTPVVENERVAIRRRMMTTVSCDHRVVDGLQAAKFLQALKHELEEPTGLLLP
ncbi:MAG TPA: dihydrolipoamide acetyltransferase family protein [Nitrospiria bacterium]|nr:dihydrolipoamide acetyltransferase family protein [Nitrospiria bacterium]